MTANDHARRTLLLLLLLSSAVFQSGAAQGLLLDDAAYDRLTRQPTYGPDGNKAENKVLRETPKVDLKPYCPRPQHQGVIGSCTGWSTGYGALTMLRAMQNDWAGQIDTITKYAYSALYIYNQIKIGSCESGAYIDQAATFVRDHGDVYSTHFDQFKNDCARPAEPSDSLRARQHRIKDFMTLFGTKDPARTKIEKTKLSLVQQKPVVIGLLLRKNFESYNPEHTYWFPDGGDTTFVGAHAMVVVGYDDGLEAFEVMNSWGANWGNKGFCWIRYEDFARFCCYALQLIPGSPLAENERVLTASLRSTQPYYGPADELQFRDESFQLQGSYFVPAAGYLPRGNLLQLRVPQVTAGTYLYAFSLDPKGEVKVHWPRDGQLDDKFEGHNESAIITVNEIDLRIPDAYGALQFSDPGTEYICILLARQPIRDINASLERLRQNRTADFSTRLQKAFGARLVDPSRIDYVRDQIAMAGPAKEESILPLVLKLPIR